MADSAGGVDARVSRYNVKRFRLGQALVAPAMLITVLARRTESTVAAVAMTSVLSLALLVFLSAVKRFGWQSVRVERGSLWFAASNERVRREGVRTWTWLNGVARLYGADTSYTLKSGPGSHAALEALLRETLGAPEPLERRGTLRARVIALGVAGAGFTACVAAFAFDSIPLIVAGVPAFGIGLAIFGALSQRVVQR